MSKGFIQSIITTAVIVSVGAISRGAQLDIKTAPIVESQQIMTGTPPTSGSSAVTVYRGADGESRAVYEWFLPSFAPGSVITAVNYNGYISGFQNNLGVGPNVSFHGYAGNGTYSASDASVPFNNIGATGGIVSGAERSFSLNTSYVQSLSEAHTPYMGTMLYAEQTDLLTAFKKRYIIPDTLPNLEIVATVPDSGTVQAKPLHDVQATSFTSESYTLKDGDAVINVQSFPLGGVWRSAIMEFDFAGVPRTATITSATITFNVNTITHSGSDYPQVKVFARPGNGIAESTDATQGFLVGTSDPVTETGVPITINLDYARIQNILSNDAILGFTILGSDNGDQFGFYTTENSLASAPTVSITYAVPEPASLSLLAYGVLALTLRRHRKA